MAASDVIEKKGKVNGSAKMSRTVVIVGVVAFVVLAFAGYLLTR